MATESDYEDLADDLLAPVCPSGVREHRRPWNGDVVRYDEARDVLAIRDGGGYIKTCYRPDPAFHGKATNLDYYLDEEAKI